MPAASLHSRARLARREDPKRANAFGLSYSLHVIGMFRDFSQAEREGERAGHRSLAHHACAPPHHACAPPLHRPPHVLRTCTVKRTQPRIAHCLPPRAAHTHKPRTHAQPTVRRTCHCNRAHTTRTRAAPPPLCTHAPPLPFRLSRCCEIIGSLIIVMR